MTIRVQIEHATHAITAHLHAVPRVGDRIVCAFPSSGLPRLFLLVSGVSHYQQADFEGKECTEPFGIAVTTEGDPEHEERNQAAIAALLGKK